MVWRNAVFSFDTCLGAPFERAVTVVCTHWFTPESMCAAVCVCSRAADIFFLFSVILSRLQPNKVMPRSQLVTVFIFALLLPFSPLQCSPRHPHTHPVFDFCWLTHEMLRLFKEFFLFHHVLKVSESKKLVCACGDKEKLPSIRGTVVKETAPISESVKSNWSEMEIFRNEAVLINSE